MHPGDRCPRCIDEYTFGMAEGINVGRAQVEAELAAIQRAAVASVRAAAAMPVRDPKADLAAAERRASRWSS